MSAVVGGDDTADQLVKELRTLTDLSWDEAAEFGDFASQPNLARLFGLSSGRRDVDKLRSGLIAIVEKCRQEEEASPPAYNRSFSFAWNALLRLDKETEGLTLGQRRELIRQEWKTVQGKKPKSQAVIKEHFEPGIYQELARRLLAVDRAPAPAGPRAGSAPQDGMPAPASWPGERPPKPGQDIVVLISALAKRRGPTSGLIKLVREFAPYWRASGTMVYSLEGSYREIWRAGLLHDYEDFLALPAGFYGGLVFATETVILAAEAPEKHPCHVVYLVDPHDNSSLYPATASIKRECILTQTPFLTTYQGAARWFRLDWARRVSEGRGGDAGGLLVARPGDGFPEESNLDDQPGTVALAAHDRHKVTMMDFAEAHADLLTHEFAERWSTRVTGHLLNGGSIGDREYRNDIVYDVKEERREQVVARIERKTEEWHQEEREDGPGSSGWVTQMSRGRKGGVIQLARKLLNDECDTIVFFEDAETPDDQDMEIQVLDRSAQLTDGNCLLLYDERSAGRWAENLALISAKGSAVSAATLVEAYRRVFEVELVLADPGPAPSRKRGARKESKEEVKDRTWQQITTTAATHVLGVLLTVARDRGVGEGPVRLGIPWGGTIKDVIGDTSGAGSGFGLRGAIDLHRQVEDAEEETSLREGRSTGRTPAEEGHSPPFAVGDLRVVPAVGVIGAFDRSLESHALVNRAVEILGGSPAPYPESAFALSKGSEVKTPKEDWEQLDILLIHAAPLRERSKHALATGLPSDLADHFEGCACAVGTFYLKESGSGVAERSHPAYSHVGISMGQVQELKKKGAEVVLANGADKSEARQRATWAALKAELPSTFITDEDFAWAVLQRELPELKPPGKGR